MNNPPASAASPVPASADTNMASTIIAFLARLSLNAPQAWLRQSGQRRRDFKRESGEAMAMPFRLRFGSLCPSDSLAAMPALTRQAMAAAWMTTAMEMNTRGDDRKMDGPGGQPEWRFTLRPSGRGN